MLTFFCKGETMAKRKDTRTKIPILRQHIRVEYIKHQEVISTLQLPPFYLILQIKHT